MKFTLGQWMALKNHTVNYPVQVYDHSFEDGILTIYAPIRPVQGRANTIDQGMMVLRYSGAMEDVIRVEVKHYIGERVRKPEFSLNMDKSCNVSCEKTDNSIIFTAGKTKAVISLNPFTTAYYYEDRLLTTAPHRATANIINDNEEVYTREQLSLSVGECVYGLGERFIPFVRNGQVVDMWNEDGGTSSQISYKNIPFYLTNRGYGVFVNSSGNVSYEVASEHTQRVQFSLKGEGLDYFIIGADDMKGTLARYVQLTGQVAIPPAWSFGLWLSTSFTTNYDEATVMSFIDGMKQRDIPLHVFHFDCFWMKEFEWCNFEWDKDVFPDPQGMLSRIKEKGLQVCVWINPYIAQKSKLFNEGIERGYLLKKPNGDVFQWDRWQAGMALVDFTNPDAYRWYQDKLAVLMEMGVDTFKTDFGERIPTDVVYHNNADPEKMHNYYTYLYNECVFSLIKQKKGENKAAVFARSATVGGQKFPVHWGGDCWATYESMAESLRGGLSLCMSGFSFWSHDIGGFEATASPDVYKRWAAFGLLSSHSRLHGSTSYRVPWVYDDEAVEVLRYFTKLKCTLMPYLFANANNSHISGIPMMRSMILEFPNNTACRYIDTQYMLGDSLMVCPILNPQGEADFYLPEGVWTDFITNETLIGGRYYNRSCNFTEIPLYAKQNTIVAVGDKDSEVEYDYTNGTEYHLFNLQDGCTATAKVIDTECSLVNTIAATREGNVISVTIDDISKPLSLLIRGKVEVTAVTYGSFTQTELGVRVIPTKGEFTITI